MSWGGDFSLDPPTDMALLLLDPTRQDQGERGALLRMTCGGPSHGVGDFGEELVRGDALGLRHPF
jgi:hypothetical protein